MAVSVKESFHVMFETPGRHSLALAVIGAGLASTVGVSLHIQNIRNDMKMQEERMKMLVETTKRETVERFLMYGYAEEFQRYQQKLGLRSQDEPDKLYVHVLEIGT